MVGRGKKKDTRENGQEMDKEKDIMNMTAEGYTLLGDTTSMKFFPFYFDFFLSFASLSDSLVILRGLKSEHGALVKERLGYSLDLRPLVSRLDVFGHNQV